jgi:hypothetical protein
MPALLTRDVDRARSLLGGKGHHGFDLGGLAHVGAVVGHLHPDARLISALWAFDASPKPLSTMLAPRDRPVIWQCPVQYRWWSRSRVQFYL